MQNTLSPKDLAIRTTDDIMNDLKSDSTDTLLNSLEMHYDVLNRTQELHIEYLSELVKNLKVLQRKDKESLEMLKKQVLSHVLKSQSK